MNLVAEQKRHALVAALVFQQRARAYDDGAEMLIRQVRKIHNRARERLQNTQAENAERSTTLVRTLRDVALAYQSDGSSDDRLSAIGALIGPAVDDLVRRCNEQIGSATRNHLHLLPQFFRHPRTALMLLLEKLPLTSTTRRTNVSRMQYGLSWRIRTAVRIQCRLQGRCAGRMVQCAPSHCSIYRSCRMLGGRS